MNLLAGINPAEVVATVVYTLIGLGMLGLCWYLITRVAPFSVVKEIEQDQNSALAILVGSIFVALSIIIGAVILSS
jgi:putative membrane protein